MARKTKSARAAEQLASEIHNESVVGQADETRNETAEDTHVEGTLPETTEAVAEAAEVAAEVAEETGEEAAEEVAEDLDAEVEMPNVRVPSRRYTARRFLPGMTIGMGYPNPKPETVAAWLQEQLELALDLYGEVRGGRRYCKVGEWIEVVVENADDCPSRCRPCRDNVWAQFVNGYLRWMKKHGQVVVLGE